MKSVSMWLTIVAAAAAAAAANSAEASNGRYPRGGQRPHRSSTFHRKRRTRTSLSSYSSDPAGSSHDDEESTSSSRFLSDLEDSMDEFLNDDNDDIEQILRAVERTEQNDPSDVRKKSTPQRKKGLKKHPKRRRPKNKRKRRTEPSQSQEDYHFISDKSKEVSSNNIDESRANTRSSSQNLSATQPHVSSPLKPENSPFRAAAAAVQSTTTTVVRNTAVRPTPVPVLLQKNAHPYSTTQPPRSTATTAVAPKTTTRMPSTTAATSKGATNTTPWIRAFLAARPRDKLLPVPKDYLADNFNLAQLPPIVESIGFQAMGEDAHSVAKALKQHRLDMAAAAERAAATTGDTKAQKAAWLYPIFRRAVHLILKEDEEGSASDKDVSPEDMIIPSYAVQAAAEALYLMVHARFVISPRGLEAVRHVMMMNRTIFGKCPRPICRGCGTLPYGYNIDYTSTSRQGSSSLSSSTSLCHRYCPSCGEVWISWNSKTDGCAWGPSWCHLFLLTFGTQVFEEELEAILANQPSSNSRPPVVEKSTVTVPSLSTTKASVSTTPPPSVFGFRIHPETPFGRPFNEQPLRVSGGASTFRNDSRNSSP